MSLKSDIGPNLFLFIQFICILLLIRFNIKDFLCCRLSIETLQLVMCWLERGKRVK